MPSPCACPLPLPDPWPFQHDDLMNTLILVLSPLSPVDGIWWSSALSFKPRARGSAEADRSPHPSTPLGCGVCLKHKCTLPGLKRCRRPRRRGSTWFEITASQHRKCCGLSMVDAVFHGGLVSTPNPVKNKNHEFNLPKPCQEEAKRNPNLQFMYCGVV